MKKVIFTIFALCVLCVGLQAQTPTTNAKGVTSTGKLDTVLNKRVQAQSDEPGPQPQVQRNFVSPIGEKGLRPQISRTGERLSVNVTISYNANAISNVTYSSAKFTATLSESGNYVMPILERGVCFGVTENPTIDVDSKSESEIQGTEVGTGAFTASLENLTPGTTYHLRGYAVIVDDTIYSEDLIFPFSPTFSCGQDKMVDADGNKYETVQLGDQCWTKTNMRVASGTNKSGTQDWSETEPYYYVRPNVNDSIWGYYYNLPATVQVCPEGWHVPSKAEWDTMAYYVGTYKTGDVYKYRCPYDNVLDNGELYIARALADSNGWKMCSGDYCDENDSCLAGYNTAANNAIGFSAFPSGLWNGYYGFQSDSVSAQFWSIDGKFYKIDNNSSSIGRDNINGSLGFSVRCVRNLRLNLSSTAENNRVSMCDAVTVNYQATLTEGDPDSCKWFISYPENSSSFSTSQAGNAFSVTYHNTGNYIVNCVAYKSGKAVVNSIATQVVSNKPFFTYSRNGLSVTIDSIGEGCTIDWGCTTGTVSNNGRTYTYPSTDTYTITVTNEDNCPFTAVIAGLACKGIWSSNANETATGVAGNYTITAVRDHEDNEYPVVQIGSQCWLAENLRTTTSPSTHSYLVQQNEPMSYSRKVACWLNDDSTTYAPKHYGLLYNWCAAVDTFNAESDVYVFDYYDAPWVPVLNLNAAGHRRGICPEGWHIPTENEWNTLITAAGASCDYEGTGSARLTTGTDWKKGYVIQNSYNSMPGNLKYEGRNASGFSALPAVDNSAINEHFPVGFFEKASFWSSTQYSGNQYNIAVPSLLYWEAYVSWAHDMPKTALRSVRCLRDIDICTSEVPLTPCNVSQVHTSAQGYVSGTATEANTGGEETETTSGSKKITHVTDQEGNVYPVVQIGSQCWMAENMRAKQYSTANTNAPALTDGTITKDTSSSSAYYYAPDGDAGNVSTYGYLYNWCAAVGGASGSSTSPSGVQGICPKGWHVPTNDEIQTLVSITDASNAAGKLTKGCYWKESDEAATPGNYLYENRNISGFGVLPAGVLYAPPEVQSRAITQSPIQTSYHCIDTMAFFWTASTSGTSSYIMGVMYSASVVVLGGSVSVPHPNGLSVRCLRDESPIAGTLPGKFTVDANGKQVYFSKGNLRAFCNEENSTNGWTWSFAEHQWDYIGAEHANTSINGNGTSSHYGPVDLFGWSASSTHFGINNSSNADDYTGDFVDWGGNIGAGWQTLTANEWKYLLETRENAADKVGYATVCGKYGLILLPDVFSDPYTNTAVSGGAFRPKNTTGWEANVYTEGASWNGMETAGAVFLPVSGKRQGNNLSDLGQIGYYWTGTTNSDANASYLYFSGLYVFSPTNNEISKYIGCAVRPVLWDNVLDLSTVTSDTTVQNGCTLTGTLGANVKISIADGATVTLNGVTINGENNSAYQWAGLTCLGDATIYLNGTNTVKGFYKNYPGILAAHRPDATPGLEPSSPGYVADYTLTIRGIGTLNASENGYAAGIGGGVEDDCGNICIEGGVINAIGGSYGWNASGAGIGSVMDHSCGNITISGTAVVTATCMGFYGAGIGSGGGESSSSSCGNILINGGTVVATGGYWSAGIGCGYKGTCGSITITHDVTRVRSQRSSTNTCCLGRGYGNCTCGTITIGGVVIETETINANQEDGSFVYEP